MSLDDWNNFVNTVHNVSKRHPSLFNTEDRSILEEYLAYHQIHGNLYSVYNCNGGFAFMVLHPILAPEDEFDWTQPKSDVYKVDVFYSDCKRASFGILKQIIKSGRKIHKAYAYRKGRIKVWDFRLTKKFLYGQKESTNTSETCN